MLIFFKPQLDEIMDDNPMKNRNLESIAALFFYFICAMIWPVLLFKGTQEK